MGEEGMEGGKVQTYHITMQVFEPGTISTNSGRRKTRHAPLPNHSRQRLTDHTPRVPQLLISSLLPGNQTYLYTYTNGTNNFTHTHHYCIYSINAQITEHLKLKQIPIYRR